MTTLAARIRGAPVSPGAALVIPLVAVWSLVVTAAALGFVEVAHLRSATLAGPTGLALLAVAGRGDAPQWLVHCLIWACLLAAALILPAEFQHNVLVALAVPAIALSAALCLRYPAGAVVLLFVLSGSVNTLRAYVPISVRTVVDLTIAGLLAVAVWRYLLQRREYRAWFWPGVALLSIYLLTTLLQVFAAESVTIGIYGFRVAPWYIVAGLVIAYSGWSRQTLMSIARGVAVVAFLVGAYATLRWIIGPGDAERALAVRENGSYVFNEGELVLLGSFPTGHDLGAWTGTMAPAALALGLTFTGRWRWIALCAAALCAVALLGSQVRTALAACVVGVVIVVILFQLSRGFAGPHLGTTGMVLLGFVGAAALAGSFYFDSAETSSRYSSILNPENDFAFQERKYKWRSALEDIREHPWGQGLGTSGETQKRYGRYLNIGNYTVDNSYLKIALDQGLAVMALFIFSLLLIAGGLVRAAVMTRERQFAGTAIAAAGALVALMIELGTGDYIEGFPALAVWMVLGLGLAPFLTSRSGAVDPESGGEKQASTPPGSPPPSPARS